VMRQDNLVEAEQRAEALLASLLEREDLVHAKEFYFALLMFGVSSGELRRAVECADAAMALAARLGVPPVQYPTFKAFALLQLGRYDAAAEALAGEVADEAHPFGRACQACMRGLWLLELGAEQEAEAALYDAAEGAVRVNRPWLEALAQRTLVRCGLRARPPDAAALRDAAERLRQMQGVVTALFLGIGPVLGEIALALGEPERALAEGRQAEESAVRNGGRRVAVEALLVQGRALLALGRQADALAACDRGIGLCAEMGARPQEWRLRALRARALAALGQAPAATEERERAAGIVRELAAEIGDAARRGTFLAQPEVAAVLDA
jgi:tetratricopeptide (TPR) repeat protein